MPSAPSAPAAPGAPSAGASASGDASVGSSSTPSSGVRTTTSAPSTPSAPGTPGFSGGAAVSGSATASTPDPEGGPQASSYSRPSATSEAPTMDVAATGPNDTISRQSAASSMDASNQVGQTSSLGQTKGEQTVNQGLGNQGESATRGGAQGVAENQVDVQGNDPSHNAGTDAHWKLFDEQTRLEGSRDQGVAQSGYRNPEAEADRGQNFSGHAGASTVARGDMATNTAEDLRYKGADPQGAAEDKSLGEVNRQVGERAPGAVDADAKLHGASTAVHDPEAAGEAGVDGQVDVQVRGQAQQGTQGPDKK